MNTNQSFFTVLMVAVVGTAFAVENTPAIPESQLGMFYTNVVVAEVPWSIHVVKIGRGNGLYEIQSRHAGGGALGLDTLSDQVAAASTERSEPVAAINGGFYVRDNGQNNAYAGCPRGLQIVAGEVFSAPSGNASLWIDYLGQPHVANVTSQFKIIWPDGKETSIGLNGQRASDGVELYTPAAGTSTYTAGGLELILEPQAGVRWLPLRMERDYPARLREIHPAGNTPLSPETMVLSIGPAIMEQFQGVATGALMRISTKSLPVLFNAKTAISGGPLLVRNGKPQKIRSAPDDGYEFSSMLERHPRTAFGWNDQSFFLVQVDGRQKDLSLGMTLEELSAYLVKLGCTEAMNLDGGGSSSLWFEGKVRNNPCDGYERNIANSLLVLRKKLNLGGKNLPSKNAQALLEKNGQNGN